MTDWRLQGQERYLQSLELYLATYKAPREGWDHDHCEFCFGKFAEHGGDFSEGYTSKDRYHWICKNCYDDFKTMFGWKIA
jgi:hypothetical protein